MVTFPYNTTDFAFTLENTPILFSTENDDTYFTMKITISYYEFSENTPIVKELNEKIPLFKKAQKLFVGPKIHRYLSKQNEFSNTFGFLCKTSTVSFEIEEINSDDNTVEDTITLNNVKFIPGPKPTFIQNNVALLSTNSNKERVTKNGQFFVAFLLPSGEHTLKLFKNESEVESELVTATDEDNVFLKKIVIKDFSGAKADVFTFKINETTVEKSFVVFPENKNSKQLLFVGNYNYLRSLECTGNFSFEKEYNPITQNYVRNLEEVLEVITNEKKNYLTINTGWILKSETETIETLLDSKKVILVDNDQVVLEMVPKTKKIVGEDSEKFLYSYDLNFQINKKYA